MNIYYYSLFLIFAVVAVIFTADPNVVEYIDLLGKYIKQKFFKFKWWLTNSPDNPIVEYLIWRRSLRLAKEIEKEFLERSKEKP